MRSHISLLGFGTSEWEALGTWATAAVAATAALFALRQVGAAREATAQAQQATIEASWPYVAVFMEPSAASNVLLDLVVRNYGKTAASDVRLKADAPLRRTGDGAEGEQVLIPEVIPTLVPEQEWRTFWDSGFERFSSDLPSSHTVTVEYSSSDGTSHRYEYVLDWNTYLSQEFIDTKTAHHAAKSLDAIAATLKSWNESATGKLAVFVRDGDARDERRRAELERRRQDGSPE